MKKQQKILYLLGFRRKYAHEVSGGGKMPERTLHELIIKKKDDEDEKIYLFWGVCQAFTTQNRKRGEDFYSPVEWGTGYLYEKGEKLTLNVKKTKIHPSCKTNACHRMG